MKKFLKFSLAVLFVVVMLFMFGNQTQYVYNLFAGQLDTSTIKETDVYTKQDIYKFIRGFKPLTQSGISIEKLTAQGEADTFSITGANENFHVLQITDVHISGCETDCRNNAKAMRTIYDLVKREKPDFIVVTGDLIYATKDSNYESDLESLKMALEFMNQMGIPWTWTYGNHDHHLTELMNQSELDGILAGCNTLYMPEKNQNVTGDTNGVFKIYQGDKLMEAVITLDSNADITDENGDFLTYGYIDDTQVDWYTQKVEALNEEAGVTLSTYLYTHIPLQEYDNSAIDTISGSREEKVDCSDYHSGIFHAVVSLGSTKGIFCGHDHLNNTISTYQGIYLVYSKSIDYTAYVGIDELMEQRGACSLFMNQNHFKIENIQYQTE